MNFSASFCMSLCSAKTFLRAKVEKNGKENEKDDLEIYCPPKRNSNKLMKQNKNFQFTTAANKHFQFIPLEHDPLILILP